MKLLNLAYLTSLLTILPSNAITKAGKDLAYKLSHSDRPIVKSIIKPLVPKRYITFAFELEAFADTTNLIGKKVLLVPGKSITIKNPPFNLKKTQTLTIYSDTLTLEKRLLLINKSDKVDLVKIDIDENNIPEIHTKYTQITNGPYSIFPKNNQLNVNTSYGEFDVEEIRVIYENKFGEKDTVTTIDEFNYPPHFQLSSITKKEEITGKDIVDMLLTLKGLAGDYYETNHKKIVCTDAVTMPIKIAGIDLERAMRENKVRGNDYIQRHPPSFLKLLDNLNLSDENVYYFKGGDNKKIREEGTYENLIPENFGMEKFEGGQALLFTRFYKTGSNKGKVQRGNVHNGVISEVVNNRITKVAMVASARRKPPFNKEIMMLPEVRFKKWYERRQNWTFSNETNETLLYRVYGVIDLPKVINELKKKYSNPK